MLHIYSVVLEVIEALAPVLSNIERRDPDLAKQARRAAASVALNLAERMDGRGRNRGLRYQTALGSARETMACLHVAKAFHYVDSIDAVLNDRLDHVVGTLVRLVKRG